MTTYIFAFNSSCDIIIRKHKGDFISLVKDILEQIKRVTGETYNMSFSYDVEEQFDEIIQEIGQNHNMYINWEVLENI